MTTGGRTLWKERRASKRRRRRSVFATKLFPEPCMKCSGSELVTISWIPDPGEAKVTKLNFFTGSTNFI
jgi:hypothetical protein